MPRWCKMEQMLKRLSSTIIHIYHFHFIKTITLWPLILFGLEWKKNNNKTFVNAFEIKAQQKWMKTVKWALNTFNDVHDQKKKLCSHSGYCHSNPFLPVHIHSLFLSLSNVKFAFDAPRATHRFQKHTTN